MHVCKPGIAPGRTAGIVSFLMVAELILGVVQAGQEMVESRPLEDDVKRYTTKITMDRMFVC
jgi:hypothetical protein